MTHFWRLCVPLLLLIDSDPALSTQQTPLNFNRLTVKDGLSQNTVLSMIQDARGFIWLGTQDGLNRYDGYHFEIWREEHGNPQSLQGNYIECLLEDKVGNIWVGTRTGLSRYNIQTGTFQRFYWMENGAPKAYGHIRSLIADEKGGIYFANPSRVHYLDPTTGETRPIKDTVPGTYSLCWDEQGRLWVGSVEQEGQGLRIYNPYSGQLTVVNPPELARAPARWKRVRTIYSEGQTIWLGTTGGLLSHQPDGATHRYISQEDPLSVPLNITQIIQGKDSRIWCATYGQGLYLLDGKSNEFLVHQYSDKNPTGIGSNRLLCLLKDRSEQIWIGLDGAGVSIYNPNQKPFRHYQNDQNNPHSLSHNSPTEFYEDQQGSIWIGTFEGGLNRMDPSTGRFTHYRHDSQDPHSLSHDMVQSVEGSPGNRIWVGTANGLDLLDQDTGKFRHFRHDPEDPQSIGDNLITNLFYDSYENVIWAATLEGVSRLDLQTWRFQQFKPEPEKSAPLGHQVIWVVFRDTKQRLWLGSDNGLFASRDEGGFQPMLTETVTEGRRYAVESLFEDQNGLWFGTNYGLGLVDPSQNIRIWDMGDGMPNEYVYGMVSDDQDRLWLSTNDGLLVFLPKTETFRQYQEQHGLQGNEFNANSAFRDRSGQMYFGGVNGFNVFYPDQIKDSDYKPQVWINTLRLANKKVQPQSVRPASPLPVPILETQTVTLTHEQNFFSLGFTSLDFTSPQYNQYAYLLEGYQKEWIETNAKERLATYTNLPADTYMFKVKGSNHDGVWSDQTARLEITILPPPWLTWWAKSLYVLLLIGLIYIYLKQQNDKLAQERQVSTRLRELDKMKDQFLANTSHELRTPLHGIIGIAEAMEEELEGKDPARQKDLNMIISSARRLSSLINDILDYSKLKRRAPQLRQEPVDLKMVVDMVLSLSQPLTAGRKLNLINHILPITPLVYVDENRLQQILHNLIGNAIKFTEKGDIHVLVQWEKDNATITVKDTGIGVPQDQLDTIFLSFEQADGSSTRHYEGAGLGLAVSKQLVSLMGGKIWVESKVGEGSAFHFTLPLANPNNTVPYVETPAIYKAPHIEETQPENPLPDRVRETGEGFRILVVDDDAINRRVLINHLSKLPYVLVEADGGPQAMEMIKKKAPFHLVLLDVMMPRMNGFEVCRRIREHHSIHELAIIFLTAKDQPMDVSSGFEYGANDYLTKPIFKEELLSRVQTHLQVLDINRQLEEQVADRTSNLIETQKELMDTAHTAGMAEIAAEVMHNMGNRLNSLGVALQLTQQASADRKTLNLLGKIINTPGENQQDPATFFGDPKRSIWLNQALERIHTELTKTFDILEKESNQMVDHLSTMKNAILDQQQLLMKKNPATLCNLNEITSQALQMAALSTEEHILLVKDLGEDLPLVPLNRARFIRVMLYLLNNAGEAVGVMDHTTQRRIEVRTSLRDGKLVIQINDNGEGIPKDHLIKVFTHGFTTRPGKRGFGLHYSANTVKEMGGDIHLSSPGVGKGTRVQLSFPVSL